MLYWHWNVKGYCFRPKGWIKTFIDSTYLKIPHGKGCSFSLFDSSKLFNWTFSPEALNVSESMDVSWYILLSLRLLKTYIPRKESAPERAKKCFIKSWPKYILCILHALKPHWVQKEDLNSFSLKWNPFQRVFWSNGAREIFFASKG